MRIKPILLIIALWVTACVPAQEPTSEPATVPLDTAVTSPPVVEPSTGEPASPYAPQPGDSSLTRGNVFIEEMDLIIRESYPPQISLGLSGNLPTPCHQLRVQVGEPDKENQINMEVYSVVNPDLACIQMLESFQANIDLGTYPSGHYAVLVNGEPAGEFDS